DRLHEVRLNGVTIDPALLEGTRLPLTGLAGENELLVRATMRYSNTGEGLHRFVDPEDGCVYLYAQAFLDDAQRVFACFGQPDLKAPFTLAVPAPPGWVVAGNGVGSEVAPARRAPLSGGHIDSVRRAPLSGGLIDSVRRDPLRGGRNDSVRWEFD